MLFQKYLASVGASYKLSKNHSLGGSVNYISDRANSNAYSDLKLKYSYQKNQWRLSALISNALGDEITSADVLNFSENMRTSYTDGAKFIIDISYIFD